MKKFPWEIIKKTEWQYLVNRKETYLCQSIIDSTYLSAVDVTGLHWKNNARLRPGNGDILMPRKDMDDLAAFFGKTQYNKIENFRDRLIEHLSALNRYSDQIEEINPGSLSNKSLLEIVDEFWTLARHACAFLNPLPVLDRSLSQRILNMLTGSEVEKQEILAILTYPSKVNSHTMEEKDFYQLLKQKKSQKFAQLLKQYLKNYAWIGSRGYWWDRAWDEKVMLDRMENFEQERKNPIKELKHLTGLQKTQKKDFDRLIERLKISKSSQQYKIILMAKEFAFLRTWRTDVIYHAGYKVRNIFFEVANRANFPISDLPWMNIHEFRQMAISQKRPFTATETTIRKTGFVALSLNNKYYTIYKKSHVDKAIRLSRREDQGETTVEVNGNSAYPGLVRGRVRLVMSGLDLRKFKRREVLVAVMTFPNFVPAMEKAAAFVTDEGGILCHAAIVSREMKKPCVIATKIATKIFKDGDLVEVDANKGVVSKINK